jgi:NAD+ synthase
MDLLRLDCEEAASRIEEFIRASVYTELRRKGAVIGVSGGIDSSLTLGLCARALGAERTFAVLMPERDSSEDTLALSKSVTHAYGVPFAVEEMTTLLEATGCYRRRDDAIREIIPEYGEGWTSKIVWPSVLDSGDLRVFSVVARTPRGEMVKKRLTPKTYLSVVAATNFKQRSRKMMEYFHADRLNYAVSGTPNRLEYDQGFFVKQGDGAADFKPIAHLYKTQVYQLADYIGVPHEIRSRPPTTDTYSLPQGQDEFYFSLPYQRMDLCLFAKNHGYSPEEVAEALDVSVDQARAVFRDIDTKRRTTRYQHLAPLLVEPVAELDESAPF